MAPMNPSRATAIRGQKNIYGNHTHLGRFFWTLGRRLRFPIYSSCRLSPPPLAPDQIESRRPGGAMKKMYKKKQTLNALKIDMALQKFCIMCENSEYMYDIAKVGLLFIYFFFWLLAST